MEVEFRESSNAIRVELNRFTEAGLLISEISGNKKIFKANITHPLFRDIHNLLMKHVGFDQIIDNVIERLGGLKSAYIVGSFAKGMDSKTIELILIGNGINKPYLFRSIEKAEKIAKRKISYIILKSEEEEEYMKDHPEALLLWMGNNNK
jgi:hypothetical protein